VVELALKQKPICRVVIDDEKVVAARRTEARRPFTLARRGHELRLGRRQDWQFEGDAYEGAMPRLAVD
jgi:hypothetical protein